MFVSLKKTLIVLVWFINGVHRIDVINKIWSVEKVFFFSGKGVSAKAILNDVVINGEGGGWGVRKTDERRENDFLENFFQRKSFHIKIFAWFGMNYKWDHTGMLKKKLVQKKYF